MRPTLRRATSGAISTVPWTMGPRQSTSNQPPARCRSRQGFCRKTLKTQERTPHPVNLVGCPAAHRVIREPSGEILAWRKTPVSRPVPVDVMLHLIYEKLLLGDDVLHQVADGNDTNHLAILQHREMADAHGGHQCHALIIGVLQVHP